MENVFIAGVGMTDFGVQLQRSMRSLAEEAVQTALSDAGAEPDMIDYAFYGNVGAGTITGQASIRGQAALRPTGLLGTPIVNVENACATGSTAFGMATAAILSGAADVAIAVGVEKMSHEDKARTFKVFEGGYDQDEPPQLVQQLAANADGKPRSLFMDLYADLARAYMERSGATEDDFAQIVVKSHSNGALNPRAQFDNPVTAEQVLDSRTIVEPLKLMMCSPISDGAAAIVVANARGLRRLPDAEPVKVVAASLVSGRDRAAAEPGAPERAAAAAYREACVAPAEVDVVELHDAAAPAELMISEELGLCEPGDGPKLLASGATALDGFVPINPSGGLLSRGHPVGATGLAQLVELADQLRGRCGKRQVADADIALAENGGGVLDNDVAVATVTILRR